MRIMAPRKGLTGELSKPPAAASVKSFCSERAGKRHSKICQVRIKEMNASELLMRYRKIFRFRRNHISGVDVGQNAAETCLLAVWRTVYR